MNKFAIAESQRLDAHYYREARGGFCISTGESDMSALQRYAAKRSAQTRRRLFELVGEKP